MQLVCIDGEYYDPYYILGVTNDDSDYHIKQCYKTKAKKYHPDKAPAHKRNSYSRKFKIIIESYNYIKGKRENDIHRHHPFKTQFEEYDNGNCNGNDNGNCQIHLDPQRDQHLLNPQLPTDFGYTNKPTESIDEYKEFKIDIENLFGKKFSQEEFNLLFDYLKDKEHPEGEETAIIHKTSDGFVGYNTSDTGSCGLVSSFNGLLITADDFGESGKGYWGNSYSDFKKSFMKAKNISKGEYKTMLNDIKSHNKKSEKEKQAKYKSKSLKSVKNERNANITSTHTFAEGEQLLYENAINDLLEKEEQDKNFVLKYAKLYNYPESTIKNAIEGKLETTPNLLHSLKQHYKSITDS